VTRFNGAKDQHRRAMALAGNHPLVGPFQEYRKTATALACRMEETFEVETIEGVMSGKAGDYLAIGTAGEMYPIDAAVFEASYERVWSLPPHTAASPRRADAWIPSPSRRRPFRAECSAWRSPWCSCSWHCRWPAPCATGAPTAASSRSRPPPPATTATSPRRSDMLQALIAFLSAPEGLALQALLVLALADLVLGFLAALRDDTFQLDALAAWLRKHVAGRVAPVALLLSLGYFSGQAGLTAIGALGAATYVAETLGSIRTSWGSQRVTQRIPEA